MGVQSLCALGLYITSKLENNEPIAKPSDIKSLEIADGFVSYVSVNPNQYRRKTKDVKKTLSIPEWLNEEAERQHINFSKVLQEALLNTLNK